MVSREEMVSIVRLVISRRTERRVTIENGGKEEVRKRENGGERENSLYWENGEERGNSKIGKEW